MKKYIQVNLREIYLDIPLIKEGPYNITNLSAEHRHTILKQIKANLADKSKAKKYINIAKKIVHDDQYLQKSELTPGRIVLTKHDEIGIVTGIVNRRPYDDTPSISIVLAGHRIQYFEPYKLRSIDATFEETRSIRFEFSRAEDLWHEGDTAYLLHDNEYVPVVLGKISRGQIDVLEVHNDTRNPRKWRLPLMKLPLLLKEFLTVEEEAKYISLDIAVNGYRSLLEDLESGRMRLSEKQKPALVNLILAELQPRIEQSESFKKIHALHKSIVSEADPRIVQRLNTFLEDAQL